MNRRHFLKTLGALTIAAMGPKLTLAVDSPSPTKLPRWRGFNLLEKFSAGRQAPFVENDFRWIAEWGFNFVRLPLSYRCWTADPAKWKEVDESILKHIDDAVEFGRKHKIHVNINLHRAPGYCVNPPKEPLNLWTDKEAQDACCWHWAMFARRYKGISSEQVTFDLLNEPDDMQEKPYADVIKQLIAAIRAEDPSRLIIADGLAWGNKPVPSLAGEKVGQSTRGYTPHQISHYKAEWVAGSMDWPVPDWPVKVAENDVWDKARLKRERIDPWKKLEEQGVGVHVGEWGAYRHTPHDVTLRWMNDCLDLWRDAGWGWALWNFRGDFGVLDSRRADVKYQDFRGHKLDRKMLDLLQRG